MLSPVEPVLRVAELCVSFGSQLALDGLCLDLYAGQLLGLLGPNGAGKTTLIHSLAGRQPYRAGRIEWLLPGVPKHQLGIVPQEIALYPDLTVAQNLWAFGRLHGVARGELKTRMADTLHWADLYPRRHKLVKSLSGGMMRRLNLACSVLHHPQILLLDEPTVGVDPQSRERIYDMLENLLSEGTAVLLTTHHLEEAQGRCDRIAIMDRGRIIAVGSFEELIQATLGVTQQVSVRFSAPPPRLPGRLQLDSSGWEASGVIDDVSRELPALLAELASLPVAVESLTIREPSLQRVFLHLTGKELRE